MSIVKALIMDAYGTLLDTGNQSIAATATILSRHNLSLPPETFYERWKLHNQTLRRAGSHFKPEAAVFLEGLKKTYFDFGVKGEPAHDVNLMFSSWGNRKVFSDTLKALDQLRQRFSLYIGSNSDAEPLVRDLETNGIVVDRTFTSEELRCYKPDVSFYRQILGEIKESANEVLFVGDSIDEDVRGPRQVGIAAVWVNRRNVTPSPDATVPRLTITDLSQLAALI